MPDPSAELAQVIAQLRAHPLSAEPDLISMREAYEAQAPPLPDGARAKRDTVDGISVEWIELGRVEEGRTILILHGGGYTMGSIRTHRALAARLSAAAHARVLLGDYRRAPEHPFPAAVEDALRLYVRLRAEVEPSRLAIVGDSAGAGLTLATLVSAPPPPPVACVCLSPWVDLTLTRASLVDRAARDPAVTLDTLRSMAKAYLQTTEPEHPAASPLHGPLTGLPPTLIQVGTEEILYDDAEGLAAAARQAGVDVTFEAWEGTFHVWHAFGGVLPEADRAIARVGGFLEERFAAAERG